MPYNYHIYAYKRQSRGMSNTKNTIPYEFSQITHDVRINQKVQVEQVDALAFIVIKLFIVTHLFQGPILLK